MSQEIYKRVRNNPKFSELVNKRNGFTWKLSGIVFTIYCSFIMLIAFSPKTLGQTIGESVITVGILAGISIIILSVILIFIYNTRANSEFDKLIDEIKDDVRFNS